MPDSKTNAQLHQQSYVLRFWIESNTHWRIRLEPIATNATTKHFASTDDLLEFLLMSANAPEET